MKKLSAILCALSLITAVSCSSPESFSSQTASEGTSVTQTMYKEERLSLPDDLAKYYDIDYFGGSDRLFYRSSENKLKCACYGEDGTVVSSYELTDVNGSEAVYTATDADGSLYALILFADGDREAFDDPQEFIQNADIRAEIRSFDSDGRELSAVEISGIEKYFKYGEDFVQTFAKCSSSFIIASNNTRLLISDQGEVTDAADNSEMIIISHDSEGGVVISDRESYGYLSGDTLQEPADMTEYGKYKSITGGIFPGTDGFAFYAVMGEGIFGITAENETVLIADFGSSGITGSEITGVAPAGTGKFMCVGCEQTGKRYLSLLTVRPEGYVEDKEPVILGISGGNGNDLPDDAVVFNRFSDDYRIEVRAYDEEDEQLKLDVLSGDPPDMYMYGNTASMYRYANLGAFADIGELHDEYGGFSPDDLLENVAEAYTYKGGLYGICPSFTVSAYIADRDIISRDKSFWDYSAFFAAAENMPEDMYLGNQWTFEGPQDIFDMLCTMDLGAWIDVNSGTCRFDSDEFVQVLNESVSIRTLPQMDWEEFYADNSEQEVEIFYKENNDMLRNNTALLESGHSFGSLSALSQVTSDLGMDENGITIVSPPSSDGKGLICSDITYSVLNNGNCQEGAWEYLNFIMSFEQQTLSADEHMFSERLSPRKDAFEYILSFDKELSEAPTAMLEDGTIMNIYGCPTGAMDSETVDHFRDFVMNCKRLRIKYPSLDEIVRDEYGRFLAGEITAEECADMIQSRAEIYLSEQL